MSGAVSMYDGLESEAPPKNTTLSPPGGVGVESGGGGGGKAGGGGITKKLARGISRATENAAIVSHARSQLTFLGIVDTPEFTFSLPDLSIYPDSFRQFLEKDLIEGGCLTSLESAGRLNWWCGGGGRNSNSGRVLWPLATTGDGNCLLHAASLGMWGFHDRLLTLRDALHNTLSKGEYKDPLFRRWKWRQMGLNAAAGLAYTETEWLTEWQSIVEMASANPRSQTATSYQSLEEVHVLALAHVLRRPIIVIAETMLRDCEGMALAPIPFGGVYLPLEVSPSKCHRTPLLLAYHSAHFSPLVTVDCGNDFVVRGEGPSNDTTTGVSIPLVDPDTGQLLPVLFAVDPGPDWDWSASQDLLLCQQDTMEILIRDYLDCEYQTLTTEDLDRLSDSDGSLTGKSKAAKQLLGVAKQFGSIGKSMSKKLWSSMAKRPKSPPISALNGLTCEGVLCVKLKSRRHQYVDQMLQNYLQCAHSRYLEIQKEASGTEINYGAGKSKFYAASDSNSHASVSKLQPKNTNKDRTLYLSRSTFYNNITAPESREYSEFKSGTVRECLTEDCSFFGSPETEYYCSKCWANNNSQR
ncbi:OTU domain-containing protein 7B [Microplitis demolitor]|uniref:OTU domain-containing protein 7B n=1 Tax=Microplitis demolitor TaxID=69319 RepID=UPI000440016C|nr:OTU domain-containing protein 7B [Microplitis demolitor]XP_053594641.1 OTU domain-containing protein 7B [Microplitis demolitor]XP_053594646.1 OTU domain-containing protein 7B [Microplitis demolitor]XP_053594650.1 OTU domain-containing protein 7B [Microplitis demolitor]XP_053594653.1 OTU domain-containing protein 7B [Microplitis demolitor]